MTNKYRPIQLRDSMGNVLNLDTDALNSRLSRAGIANIRYRGTSRPGVLESEAGWLIKEYTYDAAGNVVAIKTATSNNVADHTNVWDDSIAIAISGVTKAALGVVTTSAAHGLVSGDWIEITDSDMSELNGDGYGSIVFEVVKIDATSFSMKNALGIAVNTSAYVNVGTTGNIYARDYLNYEFV
jgi:YD repeat-containing protein